MMLTDIKKMVFFLYKPQMIAGVLFAGSLFLALSFYSYHPHDPSWFYYTSRVTVPGNWCGVAGAQSAALLFYFFGFATWLLIASISFLGYLLLRQRSLLAEWERVVACFLLLGVLAAWCHKCQLVAGGSLGIRVANSLALFFDEKTTAFLLYAVALASLVVLFRFAFMPLVHAVVYAVCVLYFLFARYRIVQRTYYVLQAGLFVLVVVPLRALMRFFKQTVDGTLFEGTQLMVPEDECEHTANEHTVFDSATYSDAMHSDAHDNGAVDSRSAQFRAYSLQKKREAASASKQLQSDRTGLRKTVSRYALPNLDVFIGVDDRRNDALFKKELEKRAEVLEEKLERFGVLGNVVAIKSGPVVTLFEYQPQIDTKISKILALEDDLALALQALGIRIIAPIPGRSVVGFEVANNQRQDVLLANVIKTQAYQKFSGELPLILGEDTIGSTVIVDLAKMPHLLIAGSTGSGKSVALNTMLMSLLCKCTPDQLKLILIDPKRLEFASYADMAHLLVPIVTDPKRAILVLRWLVQEMESRYEKIAQYGVRNIADYNIVIAQNGGDEALPFIVVIIDELSDLMITTGRDIEDVITRITQMARAAGIHMIVATQRPSVDVITGLIKVNFPSRVSFRVTSKVDSRTILDCGGADKLLGRGDMLFLDSTASMLKRVHGAYVSDEEIDEVVQHIRAERPVDYRDIAQELVTDKRDVPEEDEQLYHQVLTFLEEIDEVSISLLQRKFRIGYNRSARLVDMLESRGLIMPSESGKTRKVIR